MKDSESRKEIDGLKKRILVLESRVTDLEHSLDHKTHLWDLSSWDYGFGNKFRYQYPIRDVVGLLLDNLNLELDTIPSTEATIVLRTKVGNNGEN